jgi:hypothetical protein
MRNAGLHTLQTAVRQIVERGDAEGNVDDRIERAINALLEDEKKSDPTTH